MKDCINYKVDDPLAFSILWQINRLLDKLSSHLGGDCKEDFENCRKHLYVMSISVDERLTKPEYYTPATNILAHYHYNDQPHPYRRFH